MATLPVFLNALTELGVHVVTVNDYLARKDSEWMGAVFKYLGLTVGCIQNQQAPPLRREQYCCDITYGTNSEFGFDYLRDNGMASSRDEQVQRTHYFAIIDEVDSILIDEARTPLIISGPSVMNSSTEQYVRHKSLVDQLVKKQTLLATTTPGEEEHLEEGDEERPDDASLRSGSGTKTANLSHDGGPRPASSSSEKRALIYQDTQKKGSPSRRSSSLLLMKKDMTQT